MDISLWFTVDTANASASPDGYPELMARSGLNDSDRETMAQIKTWYDAPTYRRPVEDFTLGRVSGTIFTIADRGGGIETNAFDLFTVGQRIRMPDAGNSWTGFVTAVGDYSGGSVQITVEWLDPPSFDLIGPGTIPDFIEVGPQDIQTAAWWPTGTDPTDIPQMQDLDDHVTTPEAELDVGFVDGETREELVMAAARGRLNPNGGLDFWQRGTSFTGATGFNNDDENVCADNFTIISSGDDRVDVSRDASTPDGVPVRYSMKMKVATVGANQKHGMITFAELHDAYDVAKDDMTVKVSISFWAKVGGITGIDEIRAAVLNLKAATPAAHPVSAWNDGSQGTLTYESVNWEKVTDSAFSITGDYAEFKIENIAMDISSSGSGAIALVIHVDEASIVTGPEWHIAAVQINIGEKALPFIRQPFALEFARCQRYCETTFQEGIMPNDGGGGQSALADWASAAGNISANWRFAVPKYKNAALVTFNPTAGTAGRWDHDGASSVAATLSAASQKGYFILGTGADANERYMISAYAHANIWGAN